MLLLFGFDLFDCIAIVCVFSFVVWFCFGVLFWLLIVLICWVLVFALIVGLIIMLDYYIRVVF